MKLEFRPLLLPTTATYESIDDVPSEVLQPFAIYDAINGRDHGIHTVDRVHHLLDEFDSQQAFTVHRCEDDELTLDAVANLRAVPKRDLAWLEGLAVRPEARGLGIGGFALDKLVTVAAQANLKTIQLQSVPSAVYFYQNHGFEIIDGHENKIHPRMSRTLN